VVLDDDDVLWIGLFLRSVDGGPDEYIRVRNRPASRWGVQLTRAIPGRLFDECFPRPVRGRRPVGRGRQGWHGGHEPQRSGDGRDGGPLDSNDDAFDISVVEGASIQVRVQLQLYQDPSTLRSTVTSVPLLHRVGTRRFTPLGIAGALVAGSVREEGVVPLH
jgi:hypothetical protein